MKELTVVVPSYNRKDCLRRQVDFWGRQKTPVIIVDGSELPLISSDNPTPNITYIHLKESLSRRIAHAASIIKTEYVVILPDDEFYVPSALKECVRFLKDNRDYASCKGLCIGFRKNYWTSNIEGVMDNEGLRGYSVTNNTPCDRIIGHMSPYETASIYAVHRSDVFHNIGKLLQMDHNYSCAAAMEFQISFVVAWMGKIHILDQLMWLRNRENPSHSWNDKLLDPGIWITEQKYSKEIKQFVTDFSKLFPESDDCETIRNCLLNALRTFGIQRMDRLRRTRNSDNFEIAYTALWQWLSEPVRSLLRPLLGTNQPLLALAQQIKSRGVAVDLVELEDLVALMKI